MRPFAATTVWTRIAPSELTRKVNETLVPKLSELPGFKGYFLIDAGNGIFSSIGLFETPEQGKDSTNVVATWIRDEKLETMIPNEPKITTGQVVAHRTASRPSRSTTARALSKHRAAGAGGCRATGSPLSGSEP